MYLKNIVFGTICLCAAGLLTAGLSKDCVHRHIGGENDVLANAYLVETEKGVVAVDATMTVAESARLRAELLAIRKPLLAVLITHGHPDHYGGVGAGEAEPVAVVLAVANALFTEN